MRLPSDRFTPFLSGLAGAGVVALGVRAGTGGDPDATWLIAVGCWTMAASAITYRFVRPRRHGTAPVALPEDAEVGFPAAYRLAGALLLIGTGAALVADRDLVVGVLALALGSYGLVAVGLGLHPSLRFGSRGLRVARGRRAFRVEWDNLARVRVDGSEARRVLLEVRDVERLIETAEDGAEGRRRVRKWIEKNRAEHGVEVALLPRDHDADAAWLLRAMERRVTDAAVLESLRAARSGAGPGDPSNRSCGALTDT